MADCDRFELFTYAALAESLSAASSHFIAAMVVTLMCAAAAFLLALVVTIRWVAR